LEKSIDPGKVAFQDGIVALERRWFSQAVAHFREAMGAEKKVKSAQNLQMKYTSFLGLALTLETGHSRAGLILCEEAARSDFLDADVFCNLGIAAIRHRDRRRAFQAFASALEMRPRHRRTLQQIKLYDRRKKPLFSKLHRDHMLNQLGGKMRHRMSFLLEKPVPRHA
jgi:hypothetical protein